MKIAVTQEHIDRSVKGNSHHCMIADAIREAIPSARYILVDLQSIRWSDTTGDEREFFFTPPIAQAAIVAFDQGRAMKPFTFTLASPVRTRKIRRHWTGDPAVLKKIQTRHEKKRSTTKLARRAYADRHRRNRLNPSRDREYGVRKLKA